jgi:thiosulfate/3-mercaptopyruvate sulfurtransferase
MTGTSRLLVSPAALAEELAGGSGSVLLDVRWRLGGPPGIDSYRAGHLPDAVFVDLDRDLSGPRGPAGRHPLPDPAVFQAAMRAAGVSRDRQVVVYDDGDGLPAARGWWMLRYHGHRDVRVLDGGYRAWLAAGLPVTTAAPDPAPGDFTAQPGQMPVLDAPAAEAMGRTGLLLDARSAERFRGENEHVDPVAGHIPGAVSAPSTDNVNPDGTFKSAAELASRFASLGARHDTAGAEGGPAVGSYCGSGVTAAHEILALALAGIPAALYVGSWSDWITDPTRPTAL